MAVRACAADASHTTAIRRDIWRRLQKSERDIWTCVCSTAMFYLCKSGLDWVHGRFMCTRVCSYKRVKGRSHRVEKRKAMCTPVCYTEKATPARHRPERQHLSIPPLHRHRQQLHCPAHKCPNDNETHVPTAGSSAALTKPNHTPTRHPRAKGKIIRQMVTPHAA